MSALVQVGLAINASAVNNIKSYINKWYPLSAKETSSTGCVRYVQNKFWAFQGSNAVKTSTDGINWTTEWPGEALATVTQTAMAPLSDIAYGNGVYVIVGGVHTGTAIVLSSSDGVNWTRRTNTVTSALYSVAWSPTLNLFLAVGGAGSTAYSSDGINWTLGSKAGTASLAKVVWGGTQFGIAATSGNTIYRSNNGTSFTGVSPAAFSINDIDYSPTLGLWAAARTTGAGSFVITSPDLITWTSRAVTNLANTFTGFGIVWDGSRFIVNTNGGGSGVSTDGVNWTLSNGRSTQNGMMASNGLGLTVANAYSGPGNVFTNDGSYNWGCSLAEQATPVGMLRSNESGIVNSGKYEAGRYWLLNSATGGAHWSTDYKVWYASPIPPAVTGALTTIVSAPGAATPYIAIAGMTTGNVGQLVSSLDNGLTWTVRASGATGTGWLSMATNGSTSVVVGNGGLIYSTTDGITWTSRTSGTTNAIYAVTYANGKFVAVGINYASYSTDGITWTNVSASFGTLTAQAIVYTGSQFVVVGTGTATVNTKVSTDGITWTTGPIGAWGTVSMRYMVWTGTNLVICAITAGTSSVYVGATLSTLTVVNLPGTLTANGYYGLANNGGEIYTLAYSMSTVYKSSDHGVTWTSPTLAEPLPATALIQTKFALKMLDGLLYYFPSTTTGLFSVGTYKADEDTFQKFTVPYVPFDIIKVGSLYVMGGGNSTTTGRIYTSPDLKTWTLRASPAATVRSLCYNGSVVMAALNTGNATTVAIQRSPDGGGTWAAVTGSFNINKFVSDGNGFFVGVGTNSSSVGVIVWGGSDGATLSVQYSGSTENFTDIVYGNGLFVATSMGTSYKFFTSTDGFTWTGRGLTTYTAVYNVIFCPLNNTFYAGSTNGTVYMSTDGITWTNLVAAPTAIYGLTYDGTGAIYAMTTRGSLYKLALG